MKAVIFDLGCVILELDWTRPLQKLGLSLSQKELNDKISHWPTYFEYELGRISTHEFLNRMSHEFFPDPKEFPSHSHLLESWNSLIKGPLPGIESIIEALHQKGHPIFALSNTNPAHFDFFKDLPVFRRFERIVTSFEVGARKPEADCFQKALQTLKLRAQDTLLIDDLPKNIEGARRIGMNAEQSVNSAETTSEILKRFQFL